MHDLNASGGSELRIGSLFSGYGGLDLGVEHVFNAKTVWFSELNESVARVFSRHWPDAPNLGDITTIDWSQVAPIDTLIGGFPCQDVSTVGKRAGLAPGTRSGLWAHMAAGIDALQPEWVVIENVRGLLSSPATRPPAEGDAHERRNPRRRNPRRRNPRRRNPRRRNPSRRGIRPVASGRQRSSTSTGSRRRSRRSGRPAAGCAVDRPTGFSCRRSSPTLPRLRPRPARCSAPRWRRTHLAAGRLSTKCERGAGRSRCRTRSSTSHSTDRLARRAGEANRKRCGP